MLMAEAGHGRAARRVNIALAVTVEEHDAPAANGDGIIIANLSMKNMGHGFRAASRICFEESVELPLHASHRGESGIRPRWPSSLKTKGLADFC
jgi:hypothetical protein